MKRKHLLLYALMLGLTAALCACSSDNEENLNTGTPAAHTIVKCEVPEWTCADEVIPFGSMVVYMTNASLPAITKLANGDIVAAFVGEECRGVWTCSDYNGQATDIVLTVYEKETDANGATSFVVRYYSTLSKGYYESEPIRFASNQILGHVAQPYVPTWK